jgi:hypothetical protein
MISEVSFICMAILMWEILLQLHTRKQSGVLSLHNFMAI